MTTSAKSYLLTAAIDFGTTYSGYAYSHQDEKNIHVNANWKEGSQTFKVPTAVLFDDRKNLLAFGYDAEDKYTNLAEDVREHEYYFFHRFIMEFYKEKAGIADEDLIIALEPECASVFCKTLSAGKLPERFSKYMVVDLEGETVDTTIVKTDANGSIKEISKATGNYTNVYLKFEEFLGKILTENVVEYVKEKYPTEWLQIERTFESVKRSIRSDNSNEYVMINLRSCLDDAHEAYNEMTIAQAFKSGDIEFPGVAMQGRRRLKIIRSEIQSMISDVAETIIQPIENALGNSRDLDYVILVGGFSNSDIVREKLQRFFYPTPLICPEEEELAVLRGAVLYGLRRNRVL